MSKIKVLHIIWNSDRAGSITDLISAQKLDSDLEIDVCFGQLGKGLFYDKIKQMDITPSVLRMAAKYNPFSNVIGALRLKRVIQKKQFEIIHLQEAILPFPFLVATGTNSRARIIIHNRGEFTLPEHSFQWLGQQIKKVAYRYLVPKRVDYIVCNSKFTASRTPMPSCYKDKVLVLHNAVDISLMKKIGLRREESRIKLREEFGLKSDCFVVTVVARLIATKRIDRFLRAMADVCAKTENVIGLVVGDGSMRQQLEYQARNAGCNDSVLFLGHRTDAKEIMVGSDLFVLPSSGEGFGTSILEALSLGIPVAVFEDAGGPREFVEDGKSGFILKDEENLASIICSLMKNECLMKSWTEKLQIENKDYDINTYAKRIKEIYLDLLS